MLLDLLISGKVLEEKYKEKLKHQREQKEEEIRKLKEQERLKRQREEEEKQARLIPHSQVFFDLE